MQYLTAIEFTGLARELAVVAKRSGLEIPGFRTPPRISGPTRTVRRYSDGTTLVSVAIHGRDRNDVVNDMIEGIVVANRLSGGTARAATRSLWRGVLRSPAEAA